MTEFSERMPQTIIDDSDKDLFKLMKAEADNLFEGDVNDMLIMYLIRKKKLIRFTHDFEEEKLYIDFPDKKNGRQGTLPNDD